MPLLRIDLIKGRSDEQLRLLMDTVHQAVVEAFDVPERDRYQIVAEHDAGRFVALDTGLGISRTRDLVLIQVTTRPRSRDAKERFYRLTAEWLKERCGVAPADLVISCVVNGDEDWSFGHGRAQFLTGESWP